MGNYGISLIMGNAGFISPTVLSSFQGSTKGSFKGSVRVPSRDL